MKGIDRIWVVTQPFHASNYSLIKISIGKTLPKRNESESPEMMLTMNGFNNIGYPEASEPRNTCTSESII